MDNINRIPVDPRSLRGAPFPNLPPVPPQVPPVRIPYPPGLGPQPVDPFQQAPVIEPVVQQVDPFQEIIQGINNLPDIPVGFNNQDILANEFQAGVQEGIRQAQENIHPVVDGYYQRTVAFISRYAGYALPYLYRIYSNRGWRIISAATIIGGGYILYRGINEVGQDTQAAIQNTQQILLDVFETTTTSVSNAIDASAATVTNAFDVTAIAVTDAVEGARNAITSTVEYGIGTVKNILFFSIVLTALSIANKSQK